MKSPVPIWVWLSVAACLAASLWSAGMRHRAETSNRAVGLMMEMDDVASIAATSRVSLEDAVKNLKEHGLVGVSVSEETVQDLLTDGRLRTVTGSELYGMEAQRANDFISKATDVRFDQGFVKFERTTVKEMLRFPLGINPRRTASALKSGVEVIARHGNFPGLSAPAVENALLSSKSLGATSYLIAGDQAVGNRALLETTEATLRQTGLRYLSPEFVQLGGDAALRKKLVSQCLRLHSISQLEADKLSPGEIKDRVAKAFRERDVRWILVRLPSQASEFPLRAAGELLLELKRSIAAVGGEVKSPRPFTEPGVPQWYAGVIALLALPALLWTALQTFGGGGIGKFVCVLVAVACTLSLNPSFRGLGALTAATVFPVFGFHVAFAEGRAGGLQRFLLLSAMSLVGGLCVAGMLVGVDYMLRVEAFPGVKVSLFVPVIVVGFLLLKESGGLRSIAERPVTWAAAGLAMVMLVALALLATRSGNDNPAAVSPIEIAMRSLLDQVLFVRPRSKEAFFGHPLLLLGSLLWVSRKDLRPWAAFLVFVGMVGQTSMVNTLCHLHTPVALSLLRNLVGLIVGGILGLVLWMLVRRWVPASKRPMYDNG